jgi:pyrroline-5-carboxylate reductase
VREFSDYGGTTAAGLKAMIDAGLKQAVADGLKAATERARAYSNRE